MKEIRLSSKVYEKAFSKQAYGYNPYEVDSFFDEVNEQIENLERLNDNLSNKIDSLNRENEYLKEQIKTLSKNIDDLRLSKEFNQSSDPQFKNIQILNRIENIENMISKLLDSKNLK